MDHKETESQQAIRATVRDFAQKEILPFRMEWDEKQHFPRELFSKMGALGLLGMLVPEAYGGAGMGYFEYKAAIDEIAQVCGSIGLSMAAHNSLCTNHILMFGRGAEANVLAQTSQWAAHWCMGIDGGEYRE